MTTKVAINGFGRIGRLVARAILERDDHDLELVSINDLADTKSNALLFQYDSTHGRFPGSVETGDKTITVNGKTIHAEVDRVFKLAGYVTGQSRGVWEGFIHSTGHGLGLEIHESPRLSPVGPAQARRGRHRGTRPVLSGAGRLPHRGCRAGARRRL